MYSPSSWNGSQGLYSPQTLIPFPADVIGSGQIYRSAMPAERELPKIQNDLKVQTIVQLCLDDEFSICGKTKTLEFYRRGEITIKKFPIPDFQVPKSMDETEDLVEEILQKTARGENVLIHCVAGRGRTGLLLACIAKRVFQFENGKEAIKWVRQYIPGAVERREQEVFVDQFPKQPSAMPSASEHTSGDEVLQDVAAPISGARASAYGSLAEHRIDVKFDKSYQEPLLGSDSDEDTQASCFDCCNVQ